MLYILLGLFGELVSELYPWLVYYYYLALGVVTWWWIKPYFFFKFEKDSGLFFIENPEDNYKFWDLSKCLLKLIVW